MGSRIGSSERVVSRIGVAVAVGGCLVLGACSSSSSSTPTTHRDAVTPAQLTLRPVLCAAPAYTGAAGAAPATALPGCAPGSQLSAINLVVTPNPTTVGAYSSNTSIPPDPQFAGIPSTSLAGDQPGATVLLTNLSGGGSPPRYVLGPAAFTGSAVSSATAQLASGQWLVDLSLTAAGAAAWANIAQAEFHAYLAVDVNATVVSATLVEPANLYYTSIGDQLQIGGLSQTQAQTLASEISPH